MGSEERREWGLVVVVVVVFAKEMGECEQGVFSVRLGE